MHKDVHSAVIVPFCFDRFVLYLRHMNKKVRTRFAPSPTGGLHLGGVRTVLFNYLFTRQQGGEFVLRIEDTDRSRFVEGAEEYIYETLKWCGLTPDESPAVGGPYGPYRQSERKKIYKEYADKLITDGYAYYAFDTPEELEKMRSDFKTEENPSPRYDGTIRDKMRNSISLGEARTKELLQSGIPYVIRIKVPINEPLAFTDMIRGQVHFNSSETDDKVLLKADGMPTYHLAVVVDDFLMKITHSFRGEEWLPSAPVHILLWKYLFGLDEMPTWAHLPLILKPDGNGKLSKRDGDRLGFPVFAMNWTNPINQEFTKGYRELGFLPEAFVNMLAVLGWNDGTEQEIFSMDELIEKFSTQRIHKGGAKFNYEKALWYNKEWIKKLPAEALLPYVKAELAMQSIDHGQDNSKLLSIIEQVKDRCTLLSDFVEQTSFFFITPASIDTSSVLKKWNEHKQVFFSELYHAYEQAQSFQAEQLENIFKEIAAASQLKPGELMLPLRIMLVGGKFGPHVFDIAEIIGKDATLQRIKQGLQFIDQALKESKTD